VANNQILYPEVHVVDNIAHTLRIRNGGRSSALVKVTELQHQERVLFYVARGQTAQIELNDGSYKIQYALGGHLGRDCETVVNPQSVGEFPGTEILAIRRDANSYSTAVVEFTLFEVAGGNVNSRKISTAEFNKH
jgi:hypothetical protein